MDIIKALKYNGLVKSIHAIAAKAPERIALESAGESWTYATLFRVAGAVGNALHEYAGRGDSVIGLWASGNPFTYAALLGTMMAGKTYLPLNPAFPAGRNGYILEKTGCRHIILDPQSLHEFDRQFGESRHNFRLLVNGGSGSLPGEVLEKYDHKTVSPEAERLQHWEKPPADRTAYIMFTSGSTGNPKGVPVSHGNLMAYLENVLNIVDFNPMDRFSQTFDLTFDLSVHDIFACWLSGGCLCIPEGENALTMAKYIERRKITVWFSVPSLAVMMDKMRLLKPGKFPSLRWSLFCGEPLMNTTAQKWTRAAPNSRLLNLYGPTEATIAISACAWKSPGKAKNGIVSIGRIFGDQEYAIKGMGDGPAGMLMLRGSQVVAGYFENENATRDNFPEEQGERWYLTGDLVEEDEEGYLYFAGRKDQEVKIRGYRVNLLEVEQVMREKTGKNVVVIPGRNKEGMVTTLVAVVEHPEGKPLASHEILDACRRELPAYMMPSRVLTMERFPLNTNKKTDRKTIGEFLEGVV